MTRPLILIDAGNSRNPNVGLGQVAMQFARALSARKGDGLDFRFHIHPRFGAFARSLPNADIVCAKFSPTGAFLRMFSRAHSRHRCAESEHQLRHAIHPEFHPPAGRAPLALTLHDMHLLRAKNPAPALRRLQSAVSRAAAVGFISRHVQSAAAQHLDLSGKIQRVIYNGVEKPPNLGRPEWFNGGRPFLLSIGVVKATKNHQSLPEMMRRLPGMDLVIAGGRKREHLPVVEDAIRRAGVADRVRLCGEVSAERGWLLQNCAGFVFPSVDEGFGMPVVEALHYGKPTFCLKETSLPEVGGDAAYYWDNCEPEHMAQVVRDNIGENPEAEQRRREWAARFSWETNADEYVKLYREVLAD